MGFFSKLFGGEEKVSHPPLDPASSAAKIIEKFNPQLTGLVTKIDDKYEAVPSEKEIYVFLGSPPGMFGIAWFIEGDNEEHNFKKLIAKKSLSVRKTDNLLGKIREAYTARQTEPRFSTTVAGKNVAVMPNEQFASELHNLLHSLDE